jgi:hypothetical protein
MRMQFLKQHKTHIAKRLSGIRTTGLVACILCSILLPFYLLDEFHCLPFPKGPSASVFMNAIRFYTGNNIASDPDHYIAIVTYVGLPEDFEPEAVKSSVDKIIRDHVMPAFEKKGLRFEYKTNDITSIRLYYNCRQSGRKAPDVSVYCFVTSAAAFALVVA